MLNRLTDERAELGAELARAARQARANFGNQAAEHLTQTLEVVQRTAQHLGVSVGAMPQALLDAHSVSIGEGAIALHSETGIPLRSLGTGSSRLLVAGLQGLRPAPRQLPWLMRWNTGLNLIGSCDSWTRWVQRTLPLRCKCS